MDKLALLTELLFDGEIKLAYSILVLAFLISSGTCNEQVDALLAMNTSLKASANQFSDWYGSHLTPCGWSHIQCDANSNVIILSLNNMGLSGTLSPAIASLKTLTQLKLEGNNLGGIIPEEFGNLTNLMSLNLENNVLTGGIPTSLGNLKKLRVLSLSQNNLSGRIPDTISDLPNLENIQLAFNNLSGSISDRLFLIHQYNFTGNNFNCGKRFSHPCASNDFAQGTLPKRKTAVIFVSIGIIIVFLLFGGVLFLLWRKKQKSRTEDFEDIAGEDDRRISFGQLKRFLWRELQLATDDFSEKNVLGQGGFGKVYKGVLADNTQIAVKRMIDNTRPAEASFLSEVEVISVAVHKNLLRLIGFCTTPSERLLVYPFMKKGSVASRLRDIKSGEAPLDWHTRKRVALGTAEALEYLHEQCNPKIIHRDVKAANVLLNEKCEAVVGDFGLAKLVDVKKSKVTTKVRGTMGHIAPEYLSTGKSSEGTDVFGYGVFLLELITSKRAIDFSLFELEVQDEVLLRDLVKKLEEEKRLEVIIDNNLNKNYDFKEVEEMIQIALLCTQASPQYRPRMSEVVKMLKGEGLTKQWQEWQQLEVARKQQMRRAHETFNWCEDSTHILEPIELSGGR